MNSLLSSSLRELKIKREERKESDNGVTRKKKIDHLKN